MVGGMLYLNLDLDLIIGIKWSKVGVINVRGMKVKRWLGLYLNQAHMESVVHESDDGAKAYVLDKKYDGMCCVCDDSRGPLLPHPLFNLKLCDGACHAEWISHRWETDEDGTEKECRVCSRGGHLFMCTSILILILILIS